MVRKRLAVFATAVLAAGSGVRTAPGTPQRVACAGDSITFGQGIADRETHHYPAVLGRLLGEGYHVRGFGVSGATLMRHSHLPYVETMAYRQLITFRPDLIVLMLGTNDTRMPLRQRAAFADDLRALLAELSSLPQSPRIWVALPVPLFGWLRSPQQFILGREIIPAIRKVAEEMSLPVIDLHTPLLGRRDLFPDGVHPDARGAEEIARIVFEALPSGQEEP